MSWSDHLLFAFLWAWIAFASVFTVIVWIGLGRVKEHLPSSAGESVSVRGMMLMRLVVSVVAVGGSLGAARLWGRELQNWTDWHAVALLAGGIVALLFAYRLRAAVFGGGRWG